MPAIQRTGAIKIVAAVDIIIQMPKETSIITLLMSDYKSGNGGNIMPWSVADVDQHKKGLSDKQKRAWVSIANSALSACLKKGGSSKTCEGQAIRMANGVTEADETGIIYFGHSKEIINHNVDILKQRGYEQDVARNIAYQIAGEAMPSEGTPAESGTLSATSPPDKTT